MTACKKGIQSLVADRTSVLVLVTDGVTNVGETRQRRFIELIAVAVAAANRTVDRHGQCRCLVMAG